MSSSSRPLLCDTDCYNQTIRLTQWLLQQPYSTDVIPSSSELQPLTLYALFILVKVISLENTGVLSTAGSINLFWQDNRLVWNISNYNNLFYLQIKPSKIWTPILTLLNPASSAVNYPINTEPLWVSNTGQAQGIISSQFVTACEMDLQKFPYDTQTCYLELTDMNYWAPLLIYRAKYKKVTTGFMIKSEEWTLLDTNVQNSSKVIAVGDGTFNYFATLQVSLTLQRKSAYYSVVLVFPTILLECLLFFVFFLPCGSVLKVTLSASLVLTMYVLQKASTSEIPSFDVSKYPLVILGLCAGMGLGALVLVTSVVSVTMSQLDVKVPKILRRRKVHPKLQETFETQQQQQQKGVENDKLFVKRGTVEVQQVNTVECPAGLERLCSNIEELLKFKREGLEARRQRCIQDQKKKENTQAWQCLEKALNLASGLVYLIAFVYFIVACLVQV